MSHLVDRKAARQLGERQDLVALTRRPADERQIIDQRLGQVSPLAELPHRGRPVTFGERAVIGPEHQGQVGEARHRPPERLVEQDLPRRVRQMVLAPHHVADLHQRIVDDDGEVVGGEAVGAEDDRIADDVGAEGDRTAHEIDKGHLAALRHAEADGRRLAARDAALRVAGGKPAAASRVPRRHARGERRLPLHLDLRRRTEAEVRAGALDERPRVRLIEMETLGLAVRPVTIRRPLAPRPSRARASVHRAGCPPPPRRWTGRRRCLRYAG